jgi:xylulokinase
MYLLGYDLGSSSVKASLIHSENGNCVASAFYPKQEMEIMSPHPGWAEQHPDVWWQNIVAVTRELIHSTRIDPSLIVAMGISYQMHGLVIVDKEFRPLRPSIIWCDSRAVKTGEWAFDAIGHDKCLASMLNSPGNFTASKLKWVKDNEPAIYEKVYKAMLPGDYIAWRMTGELFSTPSGLSEGIFWDFEKNDVSSDIMDVFGFDRSFIPEITPGFSQQGKLSANAAKELGLLPGVVLSYRAGDQPNNAFSLNVLNPGEIAATAGTSGVVYGVSDQVRYDPLSRVNTFAHVNHAADKTRLGVLLCVNGTGSMNSWLKRNMAGNDISYEQMNDLASNVAVGSDDLYVFPFGNGAERMLGNKDLGCIMQGLNFNRHDKSHVYRAAQEGIVFAFKYGIDIMEQTGINPSVIRAGKANMFLSPIFRDSLAAITGASIELYNTDGSQGAARGAGLGAGIYKKPEEAFNGLQVIETIEPDQHLKEQLDEAYSQWVQALESNLKD